MSTALAIASVTYVLKDLLNNGIIDADVSSSVAGDIKVTALPPDRVDATADNEQNQLNLFMYQATPNQGWRNEGYPRLDSQGNRIGNPPLALDLHYLMTAYSVSELHSEILLGYGMQLLHEMPVLIRDDIRTSLNSGPITIDGGLPANLLALSTSGLADQVEQIKITPETLTAGDLFNLWNAFQAKYRPTAAYRVTVVLIQSTASTQVPLPVRKRHLQVIPLALPTINTLSSQPAGGGAISRNRKILPGDNLVVNGVNLSGTGVMVNIDGDLVVPSSVSDAQITVTLPVDLPAGTQSVVVEKTGFSSNAAAFVLNPTLTITGSAIVGGSGTISISILPAPVQGQTVVLLLNLMGVGSPPSPPAAYSFPVSLTPPSSPPGDFTVSVSNLTVGNYLVRVQVDGGESPLTVDGTGKYNGPSVTVN